MENWLGWLIVIIILTILEISTVSLVSVWFIASAIISLIVSFITDSFLIQFIIFVIGGIIFLLITRPLLEKKIKEKNVKTNFDRVIGMIGKVTEEIEPDGIGEVYVDGKKWSAISEEKIGKNEKVTVLAIKGVKLCVRKESK